MRIVKYVEEGMSLPRWYGAAWRNWMTGETVALPLGLNKVAGWVRWIYHRLISKVRPSILEEARIAGLREGRSLAEDRFKARQNDNRTS